MVADTRHIGPIPLDELHDPKRIWALGSDDPAELRAEIARLRAELGDRRAALSRPFPVAILHWPARELAELLTSYPTLASEYPSHEAHLRDIESSLRALAASGTTNLGIVTASVPSYEAFAASEKTSPASPSLLAEYATTLAARGKATPGPPPRRPPAGAPRASRTRSATARPPGQTADEQGAARSAGAGRDLRQHGCRRSFC